ncbi:MAG TPA: FecR family protein [Chitinophagaceae bacterium]|nr:FecR family protein [Chitinophagaceae bacterium]
MTNEELKILVEKYLADTASGQEKAELEAWYASQDSRPDLFEDERSAEASQWSDEIWQSVNKRTIQQPAVEIKTSKRWYRWVAAASILLIGVSVSWFVLNRPQKNTEPEVASRYTGTDVLPGSFKAKLTLADGRSIVLDSTGRGELAKQGTAAVVNQDGQLTYNDTKTSAPDLSPLYNTVSTNKGETYSLQLADGSIISLNSGSSVYFPASFPGKERRIKIRGEVFVKVAKNPQQPFIAEVNGMEVLALGTEFNINSYADEGVVRTTLIEGSVKVSKGESLAILKPGQQAVLGQAQNEITVSKDIDLKKTLAWVSNKFIFEKDELPMILRQLARWYDIEVVYEGKLPSYKFSGIISRQQNASAVLSMLKETGSIHFRIEGKTLIVTP